ncbi:hypothetical protein A8C75_09610 [Marinobacterium aestuarii]|uniref:HTH luxR-type domain-containing protein n=1 Tax=Marinobacterium aestuarii TaxID=1821621 RepID=A0A1A9EX46_9GAMM|nr:LuxR C-terminal-related transcriptional regulator [Marinobacterium aestuarii]ANG62714.1 hypothetical protein A8C75_09610 [Marinobacterium aestuarii]
MSRSQREGRGPPGQGLTLFHIQAELAATGDQVAARLSISKRTVDNHRANIRKKLNLNNAAELTRYALENGLLGEPGSGFKR